MKRRYPFLRWWILEQALKNNPLRLVAGVLLSLLLFASFAWAQANNDLVPVPKFDYVTDTASLFTPEQRQALYSKLENFEKKTGSQVCVVVVPSTNGEGIEAFAHRVGSEWKPGRKDYGDGSLFIVAVKDRQARIDVMRALEGAIPDVAAYQILQEDVFPSFMKDNYYEGIDKGLDGIFKLIENEQLPAPGKEEEKSSPFGSGALWDQPWIAIIFIGFVITMMMRQLLGMKSAPVAGVLVGALGWFIMQSWLAGLIIAVIVTVINLLIPTSLLEAGARRTARMYNRKDRRFRGNGRDGFGGGFGGGGDGSGDSGGSGGGASSGGGGDSGGGGASGSW